MDLLGGRALFHTILTLIPLWTHTVLWVFQAQPVRAVVPAGPSSKDVLPHTHASNSFAFFSVSPFLTSCLTLQPTHLPTLEFHSTHHILMNYIFFVIY